MSKRDGLKLYNEIMEVDKRNHSFVYINTNTGEESKPSLARHYLNIERYHLLGSVPEDVATQYDVARNIYIYAWYEYRFYNVAEAQVLIALELAMKQRIGENNLKQYISKRKKEHKRDTGKGINLSRGMKVMMEYCRDHSLICNEGFTQWKNYATQRAYREKECEQEEWAREEMRRTGKKEVILPDIVMEELPPDPNYDHVQHLIDHTNKWRNEYAHGSTFLYNDVLWRFEMVSEFINQIFSKE